MKKILTFLFIFTIFNINNINAETIDTKCDKIRMATIIVGVIHQQQYSKLEALNMINEMHSADTRQVAFSVLDEIYTKKRYDKKVAFKNISNFAKEKYVECMRTDKKFKRIKGN